MKLKSFLAAVLLVINFSIGAFELDGEALLSQFNQTIDQDLKGNPYIHRLINQNQEPTTKTSAKESFEEQFLRQIMIECGILPAPGTRSAAIAARRRIRRTAQLLNRTDETGELRR